MQALSEGAIPMLGHNKSHRLFPFLPGSFISKNPLCAVILHREHSVPIATLVIVLIFLIVSFFYYQDQVLLIISIYNKYNKRIHYLVC